MAIKAASVLHPFWFEPEEGGPRFKVRGLTSLELFDVNANAMRSGEEITWTSGSVRAALKSGLLGWENLTDADGAAVEFGKRTLENIDRLDLQTCTAVFGAILGASSIGGEQAKN